MLVARSADSFLASSREQFYVSVSRGKRSIRIYTDDRQGLQEAVGGSSTRRAGLSVAKTKAPHPIPNGKSQLKSKQSICSRTL